MGKYMPEGRLLESEKNSAYLKSLSNLSEAFSRGEILEGRAVSCNQNHDLIVDLGFCTGLIPRSEGAIGIDDGETKDIALISRVGKSVCFKIVGFNTENEEVLPILSRRQCQMDCMKNYVKTLKKGDIIEVRVTHLEPFGAFCDIGCGIIALMPIDCISVSRISHPKDRFYKGQYIKAVVKAFDEMGRITLSHKELLGSWEENARNFQSGETVSAIVRSIEPYGIFAELAPNLAGLAETKEGVAVGDRASVFIKSLIPEKMKVKLIIVDSFKEEKQTIKEPEYFVSAPHIDKWTYSPENAKKQIETVFLDQ